jgi:hypothetical protein
MSEILNKLQALQSNLSQKELIIFQLTSQVDDLKTQNSSFLLQVDFLQNSNQDLQNQVFKVTEDFNFKSQQVMILENECKMLRNQLNSQENFIENWKKVAGFSESFEKYLELERVRMMHCELEARFLREKIEMLENESKMKDLVLKLTDSKSQVLWEKRDKWLASLPEMEKLPQAMIEEQEREEKEKTCESINQVLKDVEILLGWKIHYSRQKITLTRNSFSIIVNKQEYLNDFYYNIELSSQSLSLLSAPPFEPLLTSAKNYPLLFSLIISKHSKLHLPN